MILQVSLDMDRIPEDILAERLATAKAVDALFGEIENIDVLNFPDGKDPKKFKRAELLEIMDDALRAGNANYDYRMDIVSGQSRQ